MRKLWIAGVMMVCFFIFNADGIWAEDSTQVLKEMENGLSNSDVKQIAGKLTFVRQGASYAHLPYKEYRLGTLYVFPKIEDLQEKYFGKKISFKEHADREYALVPNVSVYPEYQTENNRKYVAEFKLRLQSFRESLDKNILAKGQVKKDGDNIYFELEQVKLMPVIYEWDIPEKKVKSFEQISIPTRAECHFIINFSNPFEKSIKNLRIVFSPENPLLFDFKDEEVKRVDSLEPGEIKQLTWTFKIKEPWWQNAKLLIYANNESVVAAYESFVLIGVKEYKAEEINKLNKVAAQISESKNLKDMAKIAVLKNPPPEEFSDFFNKQVRVCLENQWLTNMGWVFPSIMFAEKHSSMGQGPVEVLFDMEMRPSEVIYHYCSEVINGHMSNLMEPEIVSDSQESEIINKMSFIPKETAIRKSRELKGGSENFVYDYVSANLLKIPVGPYYLWKVKYHINKDVAKAAYNDAEDYIHPKTASLVLGMIVVKLPKLNGLPLSRE